MIIFKLYVFFDWVANKLLQYNERKIKNIMYDFNKFYLDNQDDLNEEENIVCCALIQSYNPKKHWKVYKKICDDYVTSFEEDMKEKEEKERGERLFKKKQ